MKRILEHAEEQSRQNEINVSFFFNGQGFDIEKSAEGMYRSLLHQTLAALPRLQRILAEKVVIDGHHTWTTDVLQDLFRTIVLSISPDEQLTCYIDALDECRTEEVRDVMTALGDLGQLARSKGIPFRFCLSSRYYPHITVANHESIGLDKQTEHDFRVSARQAYSHTHSKA